MKFFFRLVRSTLDWVHPQPGEDWGHRLSGTVATIVTFPVVLAACAVLVLGSVAFPAFDPAAYGVKSLFVALWLLIWVSLFVPVDRITARHLAGEEPAESKWLILKFTAGTFMGFVLASSVAVSIGDP